MAKSWFRWVVLIVTPALVGFWFWRGVHDPVQAAAVLGLALAAVVAAVRQSRAQAVQRWRTALDAYAERALAGEHAGKREPRRHAGPKVLRRPGVRTS